MESEQEMMARIARLAGQINRHKNQQTSYASTQAPPGAPYPPPHYNHAYAPHRGGYRGRGSYRGGRGGAVHRNRTLVLNNTGSANDNKGSGDSDSSTTAQNPAWVVKTDRHMQLINPAIYEKQSSDRAKAIEETRLLRLKQKDDREKFKLSKHLAQFDSTGVPRNPTMRQPQNYEVYVEGIRFVVMKDGSKLKRVDGDESTAKMTPKSATIGGVRFYRSKHGNLYRSAVVNAQRYDLSASRKSKSAGTKLTQGETRKTGVVKKVDEPCRIFSTTGVCPKGPRCRYLHDPTKVAVCKELLQKGACTAGDSCDLSHDLTPERTPACLHFAKGNCSNENCPYSHVRVSPSALVCRPFGIYGYCEKGAACTERHVHECPDFSNTGVCKTKGCKLPHRLKASTLRKNAAKMGENGEEESSDLSSDDDAEEIDSDDVDSDDLEFLGGDDGEMDSEIPQQSDYVHL